MKATIEQVEKHVSLRLNETFNAIKEIEFVLSKLKEIRSSSVSIEAVYGYEISTGESYFKKGEERLKKILEQKRGEREAYESLKNIIG